MSMVDIIPGINENDFEKIKSEVELVRDLVDWIHIDVLDNTLIPLLTYNTFSAFPALNFPHFEAHLMVLDPRRYIKVLVENGFKRLIAQVEADGIRDFVHEAKLAGVEVGLAIDSGSELEVIEPFLDGVDVILVMMYKAGSSGQVFQQSNIHKIRKIYEEYKNLPIEADGGVDKETALLLREAGATRLVSTSYLFWKNRDRIAEAIAELKG